MPVRVTDIAHVRFEAPDLDEVEAFYRDFGLQVAHRDDTSLALAAADGRVVHVTERGDDARFVGLGFDATRADLDDLVENDGFTRVDDPLLGEHVVGADPDGWRVDVVCSDDAPRVDAARQDANGHPGGTSRPVRNDAEQQLRRGEPLRLRSGPSLVQRLGHCVLNATDYATSAGWYREHLGLVTSDEIRLDDGHAIGAFLRCDRGPVYVDHHTLFIVGAGTPAFNHAAFEVTDLDDLMTGHSHLHGSGHRAQWGVGRHVLGSQIYDYWLDPNGHMVEHWTDGDLFNDETPPNVASLDELMASQWGPTAGGPR